MISMIDKSATYITSVNSTSKTRTDILPFTNFSVILWENK